MEPTRGKKKAFLPNMHQRQVELVLSCESAAPQWGTFHHSHHRKLGNGVWWGCWKVSSWHVLIKGRLFNSTTWSEGRRLVRIYKKQSGRYKKCSLSFLSSSIKSAQSRLLCENNTTPPFWNPLLLEWWLALFSPQSQIQSAHGCQGTVLNYETEVKTKANIE